MWLRAGNKTKSAVSHPIYQIFWHNPGSPRAHTQPKSFSSLKNIEKIISVKIPKCFVLECKDYASSLKAVMFLAFILLSNKWKHRPENLKKIKFFLHKKWRRGAGT